MGQGNVIANLGSIPIHGGQQDLACPALGNFLGPGNRIQTSILTAPADKDLKPFPGPFGIDGDDDVTLTPKTLRSQRACLSQFLFWDKLMNVRYM